MMLGSSATLKHLFRRSPVAAAALTIPPLFASPAAGIAAFTSRSPAIESTSRAPTTSRSAFPMESSIIDASYWNRETSKHGEYEYEGEISRVANIVCLGDPDDKDNAPLYNTELPSGSSLLATGYEMSHFDLEALKDAKPDVIFVSHGKARKPLVDLLRALPSVRWVHARSAGIDHISCPDLASVVSEHNVVVTNAKGCFSSTLAEYTMMAVCYFAKDLPRLLKNKQNKDWDRYDVLEVRGATLGIIGYGDIGKACAKLAKAFGMDVVALRRNPKNSEGDAYVNQVFGNDKLHDLASVSDYIVIAAPLTEATRGLVSADVIANAKKDAVLINVGRGPIIDEEAMIKALQDGTLKGAAMDVTTIEPLPQSSKLWELDNVLLSPHNMDKTATFMKEATEMFVNENLQRYVRGKDLLNPVDVKAGY